MDDASTSGDAGALSPAAVAIICATVTLVLVAAAGLAYHDYQRKQHNRRVLQALGTHRCTTTTANAIYTQASGGGGTGPSVLVRASSTRGGLVDASGYAVGPEGSQGGDTAVYSVPLDKAGGGGTGPSVLVRASSTRGGLVDASGYAVGPEGSQGGDTAVYSVPLDTAGYDGYAALPRRSSVERPCAEACLACASVCVPPNPSQHAWHEAARWWR